MFLQKNRLSSKIHAYIYMKFFLFYRKFFPSNQKEKTRKIEKTLLK